jgi:hypothetical protein
MYLRSAEKLHFPLHFSEKSLFCAKTLRSADIALPTKKRWTFTQVDIGRNWVCPEVTFV